MTSTLPYKAMSTLLLKQNEKINFNLEITLLDMDIQSGNPDMSSVVLSGPRSHDIKTWSFPGYLVITNKRLLFIEQIWGFLGPKDEYNLRDIIDLESIQGMSIYKKFPGGLRLGIRYNSHGAIHERGFKGSNLDENYLYGLKRMIEDLLNRRIAEVEEEKKKERIQYVIDFSFIRSQLDKGGIALTTIKCPNCGANVSVPDSGNFFTCNYCNSTIHAMDVFQKMKGLIEKL